MNDTTVHCQEFHELAMDYRGASATTVHAAYEALCKYVEMLIDNGIYQREEQE